MTNALALTGKEELTVGTGRVLEKEYLSELFPKLELEELLGANMATVYRARQIGLDRTVVLKAYATEFSADASDVQRFRREAESLAKLKHPNIVTVFDFDSVDGIYYFIMDFVQGERLRDAASRLEGRDCAAQIAEWTCSLCDAVQFAHDNGVVHRDLKPDNIIVTDDGRPILIDFGLAKLLRSSADAERLTQTEQSMGTAHYMAPEQLHDASNVDHRADVFSLGVVLYELVTGQVPIGQIPSEPDPCEPLERLGAVHPPHCNQSHVASSRRPLPECV